MSNKKMKKKILYLLGMILVIVALVSIVDAVRPKHNEFVRTGNMVYPRYGHKSVLLKDGRVLIIGGSKNRKSCEIYTPKTGKFSLVGDLSYFHDENSTATLLNNGRVLITGGVGADTGTELFNPQDNTFKSISNMKISIHYHTASLLPDGKVLIIGSEIKQPNKYGFRPVNNNFQRAEIFDPVTNKFTFGPTTNLYRFMHHSISLPDGNILILPMDFYTEELTKNYKKEISLSPPAEMYDAKTNKFKLLGKFVKPFNWSATDIITNYFLLKNNKILLVMCNDRNYVGIAIYDYQTNIIKYLYRFEDSIFYQPSNPVLLKDKDSILFMGGVNGPQPLTQAIKTTEIINYKTLNRTKGPIMKDARYGGQSIIELKNGDILITGGWDNNRNSAKKAELYKK